MKKVILISIIFAGFIQLKAQSNNTSVNFGWFDVQKNNAMVQAAWQTTIESNNRGFELQRRTGDGPWAVVSYIATAAPDGNSNRILKYTYDDPTSITGTTQYRVKQTGVNGAIAYSETRTINNSPGLQRASVYPNPSTDGRFTIALPGVNTFHDVQLINMGGVLVKEWKSVTGSNYDVSGILPGQYLVRIVNRENRKIIVEKLIVTQ